MTFLVRIGDVDFGLAPCFNDPPSRRHQHSAAKNRPNTIQPWAERNDMCGDLSPCGSYINLRVTHKYFLSLSPRRCNLMHDEKSLIPLVVSLPDRAPRSTSETRLKGPLQRHTCTWKCASKTNNDHHSRQYLSTRIVAMERICFDPKLHHLRTGEMRALQAALREPSCAPTECDKILFHSRQHALFWGLSHHV